MKKFMITSILLALLTTPAIIMAQDRQEESLGLPGDNLNLYAVMKLFRESATLEEFERNLNDENSKINNLDLNGDNIVDYIRVLDFVDRDVHTIVLQVPVNQNENQDVAVFTVQRNANGEVQVQLTGDESLYGKDYIIEPIFDEGNTPNPGYYGNTRTIDGRNVPVYRTTTVEIAAWPIVRFIYMPAYVGWRSSWYYDYYPPYWRPWHPFFWHYYFGYHYNWYNDYYSHYRHANYHRYNRWNDYYYVSRRAYSANVSGRIHAGNYKSTYSRPDQRRDGEALYSKMHPSQNSRRSDNSSGNNNVRRSGSRPIPDRQPGGTATNRRSTNTTTNKPASNPRSDQNMDKNRRSTSTMTNKPASTPRSDQNVGTTRRSNNTVANRSGSNPPLGQKAGSTRSSRKSATNAVKSSGRRNSGNSKSEATSKKSGKTKNSETTKSSRRR